MPVNPDLYLSVEDYRTKTQAPSLVGDDDEGRLSDDAAEDLLLETMTSIDAYIGPGWTPLEDDQEFIFPREQDTDSDDNPTIPRAVAIATRMVADAILLRRPTGGNQGVLAQEVASETSGGHFYAKKTSSQPLPGFEWWPPEAFAYLAIYVRHGGVFALDQTGCV